MPDKEQSDFCKKPLDFDAISKVYDQVRTGNPEMIYHMLQGVALKAESIVLDVGCGTGSNTLLFAKATNTLVIGVDLSRGMLKKARDKAPGLDVIQGSADHLPFRDRLFDFVFMTDVVHHFSCLHSAFLEIFRVTGQGGGLCIVTQSLKQIEQRVTSRFFPTTVDVDKARYPRIEKIEHTMLSVGYIYVRSDPHDFTPVTFGQDYLKTVEKRGYSSLHKISEDEYQKGLRALKTALAHGEELRHSTKYTFIWANRI